MFKFRFIPLLLAALVAIPLPGHAQSSSLRIYGSLSNFDCYNDTPDDCEGFEIEIHNMRKEDVIHTWNYSAFGGPTVTTLGSGLSTSALVRYYSSTAVVAPGHMTHFGVTLTRVPTAGSISYRWLPKASTANPNPPPIPVELPQHQSTLDIDGIHDSISNDTSHDIWVLPFGHKVSREVELEELMTDNSLVTDAIPLGSGNDHLRPNKLSPGEQWVHDDPPGVDDTQSDVLWFKVYEDTIIYDDRGRPRHEPGQQIATVMNATISGDVVPLAPSAFYLADTQLTGSQLNQAMVLLNGTAPSSGAQVTLTSSNPFAIPPATLFIPGGEDYAIFDIATTPVAFATPITITARIGDSTKTATFTINPPSLSQVWLSYSTATSGTTFSGAVYLLGPAPAQGMTVKLHSENPILTTPILVQVPAGASMATFDVSSPHVKVPITVRLNAHLNKKQVSTSVRLIP